MFLRILHNIILHTDLEFLREGEAALLRSGQSIKLEGYTLEILRLVSTLYILYSLNKYF